MTWNFIFGSYDILIQSQEVGHPSNGIDFSTYYQSDTYIRENYQFEYNIDIAVNFFNSSVNDQFKNYSFMKEIKLFNKKFKYNKIADDEIILIYKHDDNFYLTINLKDYSTCYNLEGNLIYDENGNVVMLEDYDFLEFVKQDEDFYNTLNIKIR